MGKRVGLAAATALAFLAAGELAIAPRPAAAQTSPVTDLPSAVRRYAEAWASRDPDRIVALHSADSVFHLVIEGSSEAKGPTAIRSQFAQILADNPSYSSATRNVAFGADFVVIEYDIRMDPPRAFVLGEWRYQPGEAAYSMPAIDVITFRDGLVTRKVTYLDTAVARANSRRAMQIRPAP
jgi:ketosteroid isomerase-like protein